MGLQDLAVVILQQIRALTVQHAGLAFRQRGGMIGRVDALARRFDAVNFDLAVVEEGMEQADGIGAAADAGSDEIRQTPFPF